MAKNIPFFDMFAELQHVPALRLKLAGAELTGASIDQAAMSIKLQLLTRQELAAVDVQAVREAICGVYGFESVEIIAGNTAAMSIEGFVYILMNSFSVAGMTFIGQTIGAERYDRVPRVARRTLLWVTIGGLVAGILCYVLREPLLSIFLKVEEGGNAALAASYGEMRLMYICAPYYVCGVMDVLSGLLRGMGYSTVPMIITVGGVCGLRLVWIYTVFAVFHTPEILFLSYLLSWLVTAIVQGTLYLIMQHRLMKKAGLLKSAL